jgi:hypothetical protein
VNVALLTGGKSPVFARHFGEGFEATTRPEHGELAGVLSAMRVVVRYHGESSEA